MPPVDVDVDVVPAMSAALGRRLREAREALDLSKHEAAAALGVPPLRVHLLEAGATTISMADVAALSQALELDERTRAELAHAASADAQAAASLEPMAGPLDDWDGLDVLHLVTTGRRTGRRLARAWPLFAVDGSQVLLLAPAGPADWLANVKAHPEVGIGPPGGPLPGIAHEVVGTSAASGRQRRLVLRRLGQPAELENGRLVVIDVDAAAPVVHW